VLQQLESVRGVTGVTVDGDTARISVDSREATGDVLQRLVTAGVQSIRTSAPSLEEVYVHVFGDRGLRI